MPSYPLRLVHPQINNWVDRLWNESGNNNPNAPGCPDISPVLRDIEVSPEEDSIGSKAAQVPREPDH